MEVILLVTVLFTLVLALAFLIERLLEVLKAIYDLLDSRLDWHQYWTRKTEKICKKLEQNLKIFEYAKPKQIAVVLQRFRKFVLKKEDGYDGTFPVLSGDLVRAVSVTFISKAFAVLLGIGFAFWMELDLIKVWQEGSGEAVWDIKIDSEALRFAVTGIIMGLGSGPVHKFIRVIEKKRKLRQQEGAQS